MTAAAVFGLWTFEEREQSDLLADAGLRAAETVRNALSEGNTRASALRSLFVASVEVTQSEFASFVDEVGPSPGLRALGYAVRVPGSEVEAFLEEAESARPEFAARTAESAGAPSFGTRFFVWFEERFSGPTGLLGSDVSSVPSVAAAIDEAVETGRIVTSAPDECGGVGSCSVTAVAAVYDQRAVSGVVFSTVGVGELLNRLVEEEDLLEGWQLGEGDREATSTDTRWSQPLEVAGSPRTLELEGAAEPLWREPTVLAAAAIGLAASILAGVGAHQASAARSSRLRTRQLEQLRHERDRFLSSLSHELRTPLTGSLASLRLLADQWRQLDTVEMEELLQLAEQQGSELSELMDDLLLVARSDTETLEVRRQPVELMTEAARVLAGISTPEGVRVELSDEEPVAIGDSGRIRQILRNLIRNAHRYARSAVDIDCESTPGRVAITVSNDGPPISEDRARQMFDPYASEIEPGLPGALGIGLHVSRLLADAMDGELTYQYDGWVRFKLDLPRYPPTDQLTHPTSAGAVPKTSEPVSDR